MTLTTLKTGIIGAIVAASVAVPWVVQRGAELKLREKNAALLQQNDRSAKLTAENERLSNLVVLAKPPLSDEQFRELLRLRGEVAMLRQQTNAVPQLQKENRRLAARLATAQNQQIHTTQAELDEQLSEETIEAMRNICLGLRTALQRFANDHTNQAPNSLLQLRNYFSSSGQPVVGLYSLQFVPKRLPIAAPDGALILRETALHRKPDGKWARFYAYGDGRIVEAAPDDENFDAWEKQHMTSPVPSGQ
jgi:hypothetical protein